MKKKKTKSLLVTIITIVLGFIYQTYLAPKKTNSSSKSSEISSGIKREAKRAVKKTSSRKNIVITKHARCRMKCRHIDMGEIEMVLESGKINRRKSEFQKKPCPVMAREGYSQVGKQNIRVVSADCQDKQTIITVIDLSNEYNCYCK